MEAGETSASSQHPMLELDVVVGIVGVAHQVAVLSGTAPRSDETSCHGGTCSADGFEITLTLLESVLIVAVVLSVFLPRTETSAWISSGPPLPTICGLFGSVTTLALISARNTVIRSSCVRASAKIGRASCRERVWIAV